MRPASLCRHCHCHADTPHPPPPPRSCAERYGYSVSADCCGHGIGGDFHEAPVVQHVRNAGPGRMRAGMVFTVEPIVCERGSAMRLARDGWTVRTCDGGRAAQFEHTIAVLPGSAGVEILTAAEPHDTD